MELIGGGEGLYSIKNKRVHMQIILIKGFYSINYGQLINYISNTIEKPQKLILKNWGYNR